MLAIVEKVSHKTFFANEREYQKTIRVSPRDIVEVETGRVLGIEELRERYPNWVMLIKPQHSPTKSEKFRL